MTVGPLPSRVEEVRTPSFATFTAACAQAKAQGREVRVEMPEDGIYVARFSDRPS